MSFKKYSGDGADYTIAMPMFRAEADAAMGVPIASGQVGLGATVTLSYEIVELQ